MGKYIQFSYSAHHNIKYEYAKIWQKILGAVNSNPNHTVIL